MEMSSSRLIPAPRQQVWEALNTPETLKQCIAGCEIIEPCGPDQYNVAMGVKIGPVSARFKGNLTLGNIIAGQSYTITFEGQGGMAGFARGEARVALESTEAGTELRYEIKARIGGELAQLGSRLVDTTAKKIADDFFTRFIALFNAPPRPHQETIERY